MRALRRPRHFSFAAVITSQQADGKTDAVRGIGQSGPEKMVDRKPVECAGAGGGHNSPKLVAFDRHRTCSSPSTNGTGYRNFLHS